MKSFVAVLKFATAIICFCYGMKLFAEPPSSNPRKSKADLIIDIQSAIMDGRGPQAVTAATQSHDIDVLTAGLASERIYVKRLCIQALDSFPDDQQRSALKSALSNPSAWLLSPTSAASNAQFEVDALYAEKLKRFGIVVQAYELSSERTRVDILRQLH